MARPKVKAGRKASGNTKASETEPAAEWVDIGRLVPWAKNPRKNAKAIERVADSIRTFGFGAPLLARKANGEIIAGHTRIQAAAKVGLTRLPVRYLDLTEEQAHLLALADNKLGEIASWDDAVLGQVLADLKSGGVDITPSGFAEHELRKILEAAGADGSGDADDVPEPPPKPITKPGDLWLLGEHRLACGSSFEEADRARLLDGSKIDMIFTDPPYGMNLDANFDAMFGHDPNHRQTGRRFKNVEGDDRDFDPSPLLQAFDGVKDQFWWGADYYRAHLPSGGSWIVWDKRGNDAGMDLDAVAGSVFELCFSVAKHKRDIARVLWSGHHGMTGADRGTRVHPTQKPIALVRWFLDRFGSKANTVLDLFAGSGSTLIGCELGGKSCRTMEIDPAYCDVIVARWEKLTGQKARRG